MYNVNVIQNTATSAFRDMNSEQKEQRYCMQPFIIIIIIIIIIIGIQPLG